MINDRWDLLLGEVDKESLVKVAAVPTIKDRLYPLILSGRGYIKESGNKVRGGNMIVRRMLMHEGRKYAQLL